MKQKKVFVCQECGAESPRWYGKCYACGSWNTLAEEAIKTEGAGVGVKFKPAPSEPLSLKSITSENFSTFSTGIDEFDRVLGQGLVPASVVLVSGSPGIGKSTLLLQTAGKLSQKGQKVLYITGEESIQQVKLRADRLKIDSPDLLIFSETNLDDIIQQIEKITPQMVIIDSVQTIYNPEFSPAPGSVTQVRECTAMLFRLSKTLGVTIVLIGHITKDGSIAGPRVLEHLVDVVLYFEGEGFQNFRLLKAVKNRFGSTQEVGLFEMGELGLSGVKNPSEFFLAQGSHNLSGAVIVPVLEGSRPLLVEVQSLVIKSSFGLPSRRATGLDSNRLAVLLAVLEKRGRLPLGGSDIYLNVAGGLKLEEPAVDLGVIIAVASAATEKDVVPSCFMFGEVGLGGEIRPVPGTPKRLSEAGRLGFSRAIIPASSLHEGLKTPKDMEVIGIDNISDALKNSLKGVRQ